MRPPRVGVAVLKAWVASAVRITATARPRRTNRTTSTRRTDARAAWCASRGATAPSVKPPTAGPTRELNLSERASRTHRVRAARSMPVTVFEPMEPSTIVPRTRPPEAGRDGYRHGQGPAERGERTPPRTSLSGSSSRAPRSLASVHRAADARATAMSSPPWSPTRERHGQYEELAQVDEYGTIRPASFAEHPRGPGLRPRSRAPRRLEGDGVRVPAWNICLNAAMYCAPASGSPRD